MYFFRKILLKGSKQREDFAKKCIDEANIIDNTINQLKTKTFINSTEISPFTVIPMLMEFLKLNDLTILYLEIMVRLKNYYKK